MRIAGLRDSFGRRVCGVQISANKKAAPAFNQSNKPCYVVCEIIRTSAACQDNLKLFRKILVTSSDERVRNLTSTRKDRHITLTLDYRKLPDLFSGAGLIQSISLTAHGLGHISILRELLQVLRADARQDIHRCGNRRAGISGEVVNNHVRANPATV